VVELAYGHARGTALAALQPETTLGGNEDERMSEKHSISRGNVDIVRPGRTPLPGYVAKPEWLSRAPGVLVIHEAGGLNDNIRDVADRFARAGYVGLAVDLFSDGHRALCMLRVMVGALLRPLGSSGLHTLRASIDWLQHQPEVDAARIGVIGFCMGGGFALALACVERDLTAAASFYGGNPRPISAMAEACPIVGSYPGKDPFTRGGAVKLEAALTRFGVSHDIKVYPGARHSFFNDRGRAYHAEAADDSWERTLAFFREHLGAAAVSRAG
jgi:carboxymethylenebutenolidase